MSQVWSDPASYTTEQWLAVCILGFILLAMLVMIHRLLTIMQMSRKQTYKPNFRRLRRVNSRPSPTEQNESEDPSAENSSAENDRQ